MAPVCRSKIPKSPSQMLLIDAHRLTRCPIRVRKISLTIAPNALGTKNSPSSAPLATTRHLSRDDTASESSESSTIQTMEPRTIDPIIHKLAHSHETPPRL